MTLTQAGSSLGTPAYMAPEQVAGDTLDHRVDIYAWGILAYEILAGAHPFAGTTSAAQLMAAHVSQPPVPLIERAPRIPQQLAQLVMRCLEKMPDARPSSAADVLKDLDTAQESGERQSLPAATRRRSVTVAGALEERKTGRVSVFAGAVSALNEENRAWPPGDRACGRSPCTRWPSRRCRARSRRCIARRVPRSDGRRIRRVLTHQAHRIPGNL